MGASTRSFEGHGGVRLIADTYGKLENPPVLLLHGGGQTRHAWRDTGQKIADAGFYAVAVDARGHGDSQWAPDQDYSMEALMGDVINVAGAVGPQKPVLVGASMGGLQSLFVEGLEGGVARAVVLVDIATKMESKGVQHILAFMRAHKGGFASIEEAADAVSQYLPNRPRPKNIDGLRKNLREREDGRLYWHWDPAFLNLDGKNSRGSRNYDRLEHAAAGLKVPTLLIRGGLSDVLSEEGAELFLQQVPHAEYVDVEGAAHMVAGDKNDAFTAAILDFLKRLPK